MGEAPTFLGYSVHRDRENHIIHLSQHLFVDKIIEKFKKEGLHPVKTPWIPGKFVLPKTWEVVEGSTKGYQEEVGSINYLANGTRPDISYTMMRLGEANAGPSEPHLELLKHLWRYIVGTKKLAIRCGGKMNPRDLHLRGTYHIDLRQKWVIQRLGMGEFTLEHVGTNDMVADGLTKPFNQAKHAVFVRQLGLTVVPEVE
ncbi:hypothetical protein C8A05DRAFT_47578 [Staphylotrichum tortipilum]|uniref:Uncharacterized protein n=1 Tax=Staphylotrichum tortipilum TaxID=2831512 RepID=A0AAN6MDE3_9PEZI|nr:hypothetical protein C8A05DRAFT_47578 [Staphylotrichum longicolle]